jgi:arsenite-transporting ATPase
MPHRRVLLLSTDPAHSLADVFGVPISDVAGVIRGGPTNLDVREIDAAREFRDVRARYASAIDTLFDRLARGSSASVGVDAGHDREVMQGLIDLAPPGIDELAAVLDVIEALESSAGRIVIMDTAPSGHALRLLEMPEVVQDWTKALMSILLKYQPVAGLGEFGAVLLKLSQGIGRLRALLVDRQRTSFVVVTRAAALPREETVRLIRRLHALNIHVPATVVNVVGRGVCTRCRLETAAEELEIARIGRALPRRMQMLLAPAELPPPHGLTALRRWRRAWTAMR